MTKWILYPNLYWFLNKILLAWLFDNCVPSILVAININSFILLSLFRYSLINIITSFVYLRLRGIHLFFKWIIFNFLRIRDSRNGCNFSYWYWWLSLFLRLDIISSSECSESIWFCLNRLLKWIIDY